MNFRIRVAMAHPKIGLIPVYAFLKCLRRIETAVQLKRTIAGLLTIVVGIIVVVGHSNPRLSEPFITEKPSTHNTIRAVR